MPLEPELNMRRREQIEANEEPLINRIQKSGGDTETTDGDLATHDTKTEAAGPKDPETVAKELHTLVALLPNDNKLRETLLRLSKQEIDNASAVFEARYGQSFQNKVLESELSSSTTAMLSHFIKGSDQRTAGDYDAMTKFALKRRDFGLFEDIMIATPPEIREQMNYNVSEAFSGPVRRAAQDLLDFGHITAAEYITRAEGSFANNTSRIDHFVRKMGNDEKLAYKMGREYVQKGFEYEKLSDGEKRDFDYYKKLYGIFTDNSESLLKLTKWDSAAGWIPRPMREAQPGAVDEPASIGDPTERTNLAQRDESPDAMSPPGSTEQMDSVRLHNMKLRAQARRAQQELAKPENLASLEFVLY